MSVLLLCALHAATQGIPDAPREPIRALVAAGGAGVDGEWVRARLEALLEEGGLCDVTATTDPARALQSPETLRAFDLLVLDYAGPRFGEPGESRLIEAVRGGKGLLALHASEQAFQGWIGYESLLGLCYRSGSGRDPFRAIDVQISDRAHPITRGLPDLRAHPDALFRRLVRMHGAEVRVLATAYSAPEGGGSGRHEPALIVRDYGLGRVAHTPLGHVALGRPETRASLEDPQLGALLRRAAEWAATGDVTDGSAHANRLEPWDERAGWIALFDGRDAGALGAAEGWAVEQGALRRLPDAGAASLATDRAFRDFELELEWMAAAGARAEVRYRGDLAYALRDDASAAGDAGLAGALLDVGAAAAPVLAPRAEGLAPALPARMHRARIVARGARVEHRQDGALAVEHALERAPDAAPIAFGGGDGEVWLRSIRVRDLAALPGRDVPAFDGRTLAGWHAVGDARWSVRDDVIHGEAAGDGGGSGGGFLVRDEALADFFLELEVKIEGGVSGVQVRSRVEGARVVGPQLRIDPSPRGWSGGVFEQGRRGWLQGLEHHPAGRAAFDPAAWNHYRIECVGPSIRCFVNGVQTADLVGAFDASGGVALQIDGGPTRVAFRNLALRALEAD